jgi:hypothetical protein
VVAGGVQDAEDDHVGLPSRAEEHLVGEPLDEHAAEVAVVERKLLGVLLQAGERVRDRGEELIAKPLALVVILRLGVGEVRGGGRATGDGSRHAC